MINKKIIAGVLASIIALSSISLPVSALKLDELKQPAKISRVVTGRRPVQAKYAQIRLQTAEEVTTGKIIETKQIVLGSNETSEFKEIWQCISEGVKKAVNWLKENGYWDQIVYMAKKYGKRLGIAIFKKIGFAEDLAEEIWNDLLPD